MPEFCHRSFHPPPSSRNVCCVCFFLLDKHCCSEQFWVLTLGTSLVIPVVWIHTSGVPAKYVHILKLLVNLATWPPQNLCQFLLLSHPCPPTMYESEHLRLGSSWFSELIFSLQNCAAEFEKVLISELDPSFSWERGLCHFAMGWTITLCYILAGWDLRRPLIWCFPKFFDQDAQEQIWLMLQPFTQIHKDTRTHSHTQVKGVSWNSTHSCMVLCIVFYTLFSSVFHSIYWMLVMTHHFDLTPHFGL